MMLSINFASHIYVGDSIDRTNLDKIKNKIQTNPLFTDYYFIMPASNPDEQLDILNTRQLIQPFYQKVDFYVLGIARNYQEALSLIQQMTNDCLQARGDALLKEYVACLQ